MRVSIDTDALAFGFPILLHGLVNTILVCCAATFIGFAAGIPVALARLSRWPMMRLPVVAFVELMRDTPFLVQAFIIYFGLAELGIRLDATVAGVLALSLYATANFSESIRGAILSVPKGQFEAARALGIRYFSLIGRIILPQSLGYLVPALTNQIIGIIKDSAALSVITTPEMSMAAQVVVGESFRPVETYAMVAVLYWALTTTVVTLMRQVERAPRRIWRSGQRGSVDHRLPIEVSE